MYDCTVLYCTDCTAIEAYCNSTAAPTAAATTYPSSFGTTVNASTTYSCSLGYIADPALGSPVIKCIQSSDASGIWEFNSGVCNGVLFL